jgi:hypothetical protein
MIQDPVQKEGLQEIPFFSIHSLHNLCLLPDTLLELSELFLEFQNKEVVFKD